MKSFSISMAGKALWQMRVRRRPFVLSHGINARCNLSCSFCEYWRRPSIEMSADEVFRMLEEASSFGIGVYNAWTVEPLLREDLPDILRHARSLGLVTSLITNGRLLAQRANELGDLDYLSVSVDGIKSYSELRGIDLQDAIAGIKAAKEAGHEVLMNCVINSKNVSELEDLVHMAESLGTMISFEPLHESSGINETVWGTLGIRDLPRYEKAVQRLIELKRDGAPIINSETYLGMIKTLQPRFKCHASDIILHVASDGTLENCRVHQEPLGNVSEGIARVWKSSQERRKETVQGCQGCLFFGYVENSLLYEFMPEVLAHYEWM
jgi:MoaA/NifB/PqqE/SkfB family radical SAM enzyme